MRSAASPKAQLGRYQLIRHLAAGGMADVILARVDGIEGFERHVVIKRMRAEYAEERFVHMFLDEARLAASLHHPNIVSVHELAADDGEYFFAMEYVHGEDLRKLLGHLADKDERLPLDHCVTIALGTAAALHHAHELRGADRRPLGIVHCDVSPANIVIGLDGDVKVIDFGIATPTERTTQTGTDLLKGKAAYMSPEQCLGRPLDRRSDVFCLGIVLYEMVTVRRLFKGANDFLTMSSITHGQIPPPTEVRADLPPGLEAIILKALAFDPAQRYQTADELRSALQQFATEARLQVSTTALADFMRGQFGDRVLPWLVADDEPEISIDFDGDASGIVRAPVRLPTITSAPAGSLLARARSKSGTADLTTGPARPSEGTPPPLPRAAAGATAADDEALDATADVVVDDDLDDADEVAVAALDEVDEGDVGVAGDEDEDVDLRPRRSRWRWIALAAGVVAAVVVALALGGGGKPTSPAAVATEPATTGPATTGPATTGPATTTGLVTTEPAVPTGAGASEPTAAAATATAAATGTAAAEPAATGTAVATAPPTTATPRPPASTAPTAGPGGTGPARPATRRKPPAGSTTPPARGVWNPNALFPPKS